MMRLIALCVAVLTLAAAPALAGYKEGKEAFDKKDFPVAWKELEPLAKQGNADAMFLIGTMHHMGAGAAVSYKDAAEWYRKAADAGKLDAIFTMGVVYEGGIGVPRNVTEALAWYKRSAERGFYVGMAKTADIYAKGRGVPKDTGQAYFWYSVAEGRVPKNSNDRFEIPIVRDKLASTMTKDQVADLDRKVKAWKPAAK